MLRVYALRLPTIRIQFRKPEVPVMSAGRAETTMAFNLLVLRRSRMVFHFIGFNFCVMTLFYSLLHRSQPHLLTQTVSETVDIFHCKWLSRDQDARSRCVEWNRAILETPDQHLGTNILSGLTTPSDFCAAWPPERHEQEFSLG